MELLLDVTLGFAGEFSKSWDDETLIADDGLVGVPTDVFVSALGRRSPALLLDEE